MTSAPTVSSRLFWVDVFRGLAILLMIPANLSPYYAEPHPLWFRIIGSYAAPTFIALSAGMVVLRGGSHSLSYYLQRGMLVVLVGMLLDALLWQILPWTSFDVLYIIGPGMVLAYMIRSLKPTALFSLALIMGLLAVVLQGLYGYHTQPFEVYWSEFSWPEPNRLIQSWFVDGWFPIAPWIGFVLLGMAMFKSVSTAAGSRPSPAYAVISVSFVVIGLLQLLLPLVATIPGFPHWFKDVIVADREGYSEIFYPPTPPYMLSAAGVVLAGPLLLSRVRHAWWSDAVAFFGKYSMLVYILHQVMGVLLVKTALGWAGLEATDSGLLFFVINVIVIGAIFAACKGIDALKKKHPPRLLALRVLIGR